MHNLTATSWPVCQVAYHHRAGDHKQNEDAQHTISIPHCWASVRSTCAMPFTAACCRFAFLKANSFLFCFVLFCSVLRLKANLLRLQERLESSLLYEQQQAGLACRAATCIQSAWRAMQARRRAQQLRAEDYNSRTAAAAAILIQARLCTCCQCTSICSTSQQ